MPIDSIGLGNVKIIDVNTGEEVKVVDSASLSLTPEPDNRADSYARNRSTGTGSNWVVDFNSDAVVRRFMASIINSRFATNNWRKHHHLPMWRR